MSTEPERPNRARWPGPRSAIAAVAAALALVCAATPLPADPAGDRASPIYGVTIPPGYRHWAFIAVAHEAGLDELRAVLGDPLAARAEQDGTLPFPDGAILVKLAWKHAPLAGSPGAFVPGAATTVQVMVKDSKRYAATGGWGFGRFIAGAPVDKAQHETCFPCHQARAGPGRDWVFTRYAP